MNDKLIRNELSNFNEKKQTSYNYETILSYSTFSSLLNKQKIQAWERDDTSFPQMGEEGYGSRNPTCSLLIFYNIFEVVAPFVILSVFSRKPGEREWRKGKKECFLELVSLIFCQYFCLTYREKRKTSELFSCKMMD